MIWPHDSKGDFTIKSFFRVLWKEPAVIDFSADVIWTSKAPTKVCFLAWAVTKGKVPTEDMLKRRNFNLASRCPMRGHKEETVDHLFIHCTGVSGLWHLACLLLGVDWVQPHTGREVLMAWRRRLKRGWLQDIWRMIPLAIWWSIWKERNQRIFEARLDLTKSLNFTFCELCIVGVTQLMMARI